jgi:hypothetical protein
MFAGSGYTGSYIFSQTIFSMRAGVSHWSHGAIIFALEAAIFLLPFSGVLFVWLCCMSVPACCLFVVVHKFL